MNLEQEEAALLDRLKKVANELNLPYDIQWDEVKSGFRIEIDANDKVAPEVQTRLEETVAAFNDLF